MKRPYMALCRICGCTSERCCRIITQRGQRNCEWFRPGLCDNPQCLEEAAKRLLEPSQGEAYLMREKAEQIRRTGG